MRMLIGSSQELYESQDPDLIWNVETNVDGLFCEASITCAGSMVGFSSDEDEDGGFTPFGVARQFSEPRWTFMCEDCYAWLEEVFQNQ